MIKTGQNLKQNQSLQQKLSPQQIQFIKLLQLPTIGMEQRIKEEIEMNPVLEEDDSDRLEETVQENETEWEDQQEKSDDVEPVDQHDEVDWDSFMQNTDYEGNSYSGMNNEEWKDLPDPYYDTLLEELEKQVSLLDFTEDEQLIADQILGSLDEDGYFRRETEAVVDNIAFNQGVLVDADDIEKVRKQIQQLDPIGIASRDLRDCLKCQLSNIKRKNEAQQNALKIVDEHWESFEKKHFSKLKKRLDIDDEQLNDAFELIRSLDPKPGAVVHPDDDNQHYIEPDFEVYYEPSDTEGEDGEFVIRLNRRNVPPLRISPEYRQMWDGLEKKPASESSDKQAKRFIKDKVESAQWFIDSIIQRQNTLMNTMKTIVSLQEEFFKYGEGLKPMILKDVAERIKMDISTVSRVVNGKYVQTNFGVFELKYFFSEGLQTESGDDVSNREVKNYLEQVISNEDKHKPLSDQALTDLLKEKGYKVARRTVSKYREQLQIPVARLRKQII